MWRDGLKTLCFTFTHHRYLNNENVAWESTENTKLKKKLAMKQAQAVAVIMNNKALNKWYDERL